jgi:hypothetical protein
VNYGTKSTLQNILGRINALRHLKSWELEMNPQTWATIAHTLNLDDEEEQSGGLYFEAGLVKYFEGTYLKN